MKLLRLKITDANGFRSLQPGFEHFFRTEWQVEDELKQSSGLTPFVCAGPNGSGKSNLLEALAAIFFQLEVLRVRRTFLPDAFYFDEETNPDGIRDGQGIPDGFELEYLIRVPYSADGVSEGFMFAHVSVSKLPGETAGIKWLNPPSEVGYDSGDVTLELRDQLLPEFVLGYSSGENEILSLPFFKMRFIQFDEYSNALRKQVYYAGRPETRLAYLDSGFSQAILLCNLLYHDEATLQAFREDIGIQELREFRIIIKRSTSITAEQLSAMDSPGLPTINAVRDILDEMFATSRTTPPEYRINWMSLLEAGEQSADNFNPIVTRLKRCATCHFTDPKTDTLYLDYFVNEATRKAFRDNFDFKINNSPIALFQAFQVLLSLNLYSVSDELKADLYKSDSHYVSETVPTLASDERIMRFKFVKFTKEGVDQPVMLKSLSDGEHQLLHSLGLCLLFKNTNSLFLLDEPETHLNPDWRSSFITRLRECFADTDGTHEMLITTHSPFLISDSKPDRVLVFNKDLKDGKVSVSQPEYNTFGASINQITMSTFHKHETIGGVANQKIEDLRQQFEKGEDKDAILKQLNERLGDSIEKIMLIKSILDSREATG